MIDQAESLASRKPPSESAELDVMFGIEGRAASRSGWSAVPLDEEASRRLTQQRIGFFGGVFLLRNAIAIAAPSEFWPPLGHPAFLLHVGAIALHFAQWSWCRSVFSHGASSTRWMPLGWSARWCCTAP